MQKPRLFFGKAIIAWQRTKMVRRIWGGTKHAYLLGVVLGGGHVQGEVWFVLAGVALFSGVVLLLLA